MNAFWEWLLTALLIVWGVSLGLFALCAIACGLNERRTADDSI